MLKSTDESQRNQSEVHLVRVSLVVLVGLQTAGVNRLETLAADAGVELHNLPENVDDPQRGHL